MKGSHGATILFVCALCSITVLSCGRLKPSGERLDRTIRRELPIGTPRTTVITFLERHHLQYYDSRTINSYKRPAKVWGILNESHGLITTKFLYSFEFDQDDDLSSYVMTKGFVGP